MIGTNIGYRFISRCFSIIILVIKYFKFHEKETKQLRISYLRQYYDKLCKLFCYQLNHWYQPIIVKQYQLIRKSAKPLISTIVFTTISLTYLFLHRHDTGWQDCPSLLTTMACTTLRYALVMTEFDSVDLRHVMRRYPVSALLPAPSLWPSCV